MNYGDDKASKKVSQMEQYEDSNIRSSFHCMNALLTISFHVKQIDQISSYLYYNGQVTRFMAEDIKLFLPKIFNMAWNNGEDIEKDENGNDMMSVNEEYLFDEEYELD